MLPSALRVHNPNGISVGSAVFAGLRPTVTDRQTTLYLASKGQNSITLSGSKLVADMQRAEIWPIIYLASSELARAIRWSTTSFEQVRAISTCRDSSNLLEDGRTSVQSQIPLHYLVRSWSHTGFEAGRGPASLC